VYNKCFLRCNYFTSILVTFHPDILYVYVPPKCWYPPVRLHGDITHKTAIRKHTTMNVLKLICTFPHVCYNYLPSHFFLHNFLLVLPSYRFPATFKVGFIFFIGMRLVPVLKLNLKARHTYPLELMKSVSCFVTQSCLHWQQPNQVRFWQSRYTFESADRSSNSLAWDRYQVPWN
jgi:hypothetical protein